MIRRSRSRSPRASHHLPAWSALLSANQLPASNLASNSRPDPAKYDQTHPPCPHSSLHHLFLEAFLLTQHHSICITAYPWAASSVSGQPVYSDLSLDTRAVPVIEQSVSLRLSDDRQSSTNLRDPSAWNGWLWHSSAIERRRKEPDSPWFQSWLPSPRRGYGWGSETSGARLQKRPRPRWSPAAPHRHPVPSHEGQHLP
jgi:hypothetical protein